MHAPTPTHFTTLKRILCYANGALTYGLHMRHGVLRLEAFADADWAVDPTDRHSTTSYCVFFGPSPVFVFRCAKKRHTIACSSTEAEYRSLAHTAFEIYWLRMLLQDLHVAHLV